MFKNRLSDTLVRDSYTPGLACEKEYETVRLDDEGGYRERQAVLIGQIKAAEGVTEALNLTEYRSKRSLVGLI